MSHVFVSEGEKLFLLHSVEDDCRIDGRKCLESRRFKLETGIIANCHGSCHVRIGNTDLLVGVKANVGPPDSEDLNSGKVIFAADCSANASPVFEGRGGEELAAELVIILTKSFIPTFDLRALCVAPGKSVWILTVDILILEFGSKPNLIDAAGIAVKSALFNTRIPKVSFDQEIEELDVPEDPSDLVSLDVSRLPLLVTATKIGGHFVVDATEIEEAASTSSVVFAVDPVGQVIHTKMLGSGTLYMDPLKESWQHFKRLALNLHDDLDRLLQKDSVVT